MPDQPSELRNLNVDFVSLVDRAAVRDTTNKNEPQRFLVWKADRDNNDPNGGSMTEEEMRAAVDKAEHDAAELRKQLEDQTTLKADLKKAQDDLAELTAKVNKADEKSDPAKIDKSELTPALRAYVEKMEVEKADDQARIEKAEKDAQEAGEIAKAERDERLTREFITKAENDYGDLVGVTPGDFGIVLKNISGAVDPKTFEALDTVLKANSTAISTSELFKEQGRAGDPTPESAAGELLAKAQEIQKADSSLSIAQAQDRALSNDRALQQRYLDEVRG